MSLCILRAGTRRESYQCFGLPTAAQSIAGPTGVYRRVDGTWTLLEGNLPTPFGWRRLAILGTNADEWWVSGWGTSGITSSGLGGEWNSAGTRVVWRTFDAGATYTSMPVFSTDTGGASSADAILIGAMIRAGVDPDEYPVGTGRGLTISVVIYPDNHIVAASDLGLPDECSTTPF